MPRMIIAVFSSAPHADRAIADLEAAGFSPADLSVITRKGEVTPGTSAGVIADETASGAVTGGAIGGLAGLLAGAGVIPALGGLLIGGPIAVALGATGIAAATISGVVTGAVAGGLVGALTSLGLTSEDAAYYDSVVSKGGVVVAVPVSGSGEDAREILAAHGAERIGSVVTTEA